eukprot:m.261940 g.261940  ORF g.261940 m.261940 type:complete len:69 (+) comp15584_c1_seq1:2077-2283(+)
MNAWQLPQVPNKNMKRLSRPSAYANWEAQTVDLQCFGRFFCVLCTSDAFIIGYIFNVQSTGFVNSNNS